MNFKELVVKHGADNLMFMIPLRPERKLLFIKYTSSNDEAVSVPCQIDLNSRYKVEDGYKVTMKSTYKGFGSDTFYIGDLEEIIRSGQIQVWLKPPLDWPLAPYKGK